MEFIELLIKVVTIIFLTMLKFLFGPTLGYAAGFPIWMTIGISVIGMMLATFLFTIMGDFMRDRLFRHFFRKRNKPVFSKRRRSIVSIWKKYGVIGVAFLTPVFFTPIPGTLILVSFRTPVKRIFLTMLASALFWAIVFTYIVYEIGQEVLPL